MMVAGRAQMVLVDSGTTTVLARARMVLVVSDIVMVLALAPTALAVSVIVMVRIAGRMASVGFGVIRSSRGALHRMKDCHTGFFS